MDLATAGVEMAELFREFCRKHLATESWDFIVAGLHYETTVSAVRGSPVRVPPGLDERTVFLGAGSQRFEISLRETCVTTNGARGREEVPSYTVVMFPRFLLPRPSRSISILVFTVSAW